MEIIDFIRDAGSLPVSATLVIKLKGLLDDANSSPEQIIRCVEAEPSIASQVLRLANSVHYAGGMKCTNIRDAITRVGYNELYRMIGALIANELYLTDLSVYGYEEGELWESTIRIAAAMRGLADCLPAEEDVNADTAYTIGLFHNIGILLINNYHMNNGIPGYVEGVEALNTELEREYLGFTNPEVASTVLSSWGLSDNVCTTVRQQMAPLETGLYPATSSLLCACILASDHYAHSDDPYDGFELPEELTECLSISSESVMAGIVDYGDELKRIIMTL